MSFVDQQNRNRAQAKDWFRKRYNPAEDALAALDAIDREQYRRGEAEEDDAVRDAREARAMAAEDRAVARFDRTEADAAQAAADLAAQRGAMTEAKQADTARKERADKEGRSVADTRAAMMPRDRAGPGATMREGGLRMSEIADRAAVAGMSPEMMLAEVDKIEDESRAGMRKEARADEEAARKAAADKDASARGWAAIADRKAARDAKAALPKDSSKLRKEFNALPMVKAFNEVRVSFDKMQQAAANPSAAGDLSLIFSFMKMLDPGSTVREGEFANAQNAGGVDDSVINAYNRILSGQRLNPEQRSDFLGSARQFYGAQKRAYDAEAKRYSGLADRGGIDAGDVVGEYDDIEMTADPEFDSLPDAD